LPFAWALLALVATVGLVALVSPRRFTALTRGSSHWVDTDKILSKLDTRVDVDKYILPFSRPLGVAVLLSVGVIAYLLMKY
jgi:hypothetical protein